VPRSPQTRRLLDAVLGISADLTLPVVLRQIVAAACELVDAEYGALGVLRPDAEPGEQIQLSEFITHGVDDRALLDVIGHYPEGHGVLGLLIREPEPIRLHDLAEHPQYVGFPEGHPAMRSFLGVPLRVRGKIFGNLYLTEKLGGGDFTVDDEDLVVALAGAAGVAIENARLHDRVRDLAVVEDRERIARDLHDTVIQRLFATGLGLQAISRRGADPEVADRIQQAVDDLDDTIRDIRGVIFALQAHERGDRSLRLDILALATEMTEALGFDPRVHFDGPIDAAIDDELGAEILAVTRELLSNVAHHAGAHGADLYLLAGPDIVLRVEDDGRGPGPRREGGRGLENLSRRAGDRGGSFELTARQRGGSRAEWRVPRRIEA
jgi:signal transduction histidine kinase